MIDNICVAGAGTMGSGIALSAAQNGYPVILFDTNDKVLERAIAAIHKNLDVLVEKHKMTVEEKEEVWSRMIFSSAIEDCKASLIIEAIIEKEAAKVELFNQLCAINPSDTIFASNTSSLSVTSIQQKVLRPGQVAGMHFFNPAQIGH